MEQPSFEHSPANAERPDVSIIVPAYEEAESLPELADGLRAACEEAGLSFRVWIVDDGSQDETWTVVQQLHEDDPRFAGLRFRRNYGKSAALALGFERARGRYVATIDADLQDDPAEIPRLLDTLEEGYDLVSGWKKDRKDPLSKTIPSRFFNWVTGLLSGLPLHDFNCGLKVYRREVVKSVDVYGELHRYIPLLAKWEGYHRVAEQEVQHHPRKYGTTKFGTERFIQGFLDLITVVFLTRYAVRPMHFFGSIGTVAFVAGFGINLWLSVEKIVFGDPIGGARPLLLLGLLLILFGSQMFTTGLLGEMVIRPRMEDTSAYEVADAVGPADSPAGEMSPAIEE
ncbi:MAG: glycosyltransferase family 2 protein [Salinibacter sp.]|uniref:glycosyltransferase family 2 protein n=1 Tax=Salinibacter sp. TaxID=2065818 RepID=UPI0035D4A11C